MNHEFNAISQLFQQRVLLKHPSTQIANGDDASVHQVPHGMEFVMSTDTAVLGVHWPEDMPLHIAGHRAVAAALSDLAAMGAKPAWIWLAIMAKDINDLEAMSHGIVEACLAYDVELAGGDTVYSPTNTMSVTVGGLIPQGCAMTRNAAKIDDEVWLVGNLGLSALGLKQWQDGTKDGAFVPCFQHIEPLLEKGITLRKEGIQCCMDISDGLLQDAGHIAKASNLALSIHIEQLQQLPSYLRLESTHKNQALTLTLNGGEDYALLFTAPASQHLALQKLGAYTIGVCTKGSGVQLLHHNKEIEYNIKGYDHFG